MPAFLEARLKRQAAKSGLKGEASDRYVYGAMNNLGAMKGNKETAKGKRMQKKHEQKHAQARTHKLSDLA
jgi:hypothetical protein